MTLPTSARFPDVPSKDGHYESFYAKLSDPQAPRGAWIRYTVHKRPGRPHEGSLWFTFFDRAEGSPIAVKQTLPADLTTAPADAYIQIGESRFSPAGLSGSAQAGGVSASWDLRIDASEEPYRHLPRPWMYSAPVPRTKLLSPHPAARYGGHIAVNGRRLEVERWPGMVGHNWGAQHAERWIWLHGTGFAGQGPDSAWFDAALGRIKLGPLTTPWIGNACLTLDGRRQILGGPGRIRSTRVEETPERLEFTLPGDGVEVRGVVESPRADIVCWVYADPDGSQHNTANCSIARVSLVVKRPGQPDVGLVSEWGGAYELGMRETDHGLPVQPFPDG
jgi:hypothetical protein